MTVKEVLSYAAGNIGRGDLVQQLAVITSSEVPSEGIGSLLRSYHLVESEVALDYFPLTKTERAVCTYGRVNYTALSSPPVNVIEVTDENGRRLSFTAHAAYLAVPDAVGAVNVCYAYAPGRSNLFAELPFPARISGELLSLGVSSEFLLACGRYAEAAVWEGKFREGLRAAGVVRRKLCAIRARRWA